jgi:peptide/nickel transport system substrate-binding protein
MALGLEGLVTVGNDLTLQPALAEEWTQPSPTEYRFKIRSGVRFWDGTPLTTDDVVYSLSRHLDRRVASLLQGFYGSSTRCARPGRKRSRSS